MESRGPKSAFWVMQANMRLKLGCWLHVKLRCRALKKFCSQCTTSAKRAYHRHSCCSESPDSKYKRVGSEVDEFLTQRIDSILSDTDTSKAKQVQAALRENFIYVNDFVGKLQANLDRNFFRWICQRGPIDADMVQEFLQEHYSSATTKGLSYTAYCDLIWEHCDEANLIEATEANMTGKKKVHKDGKKKVHIEFSLMKQTLLTDDSGRKIPDAGLPTTKAGARTKSRMHLVADSDDPGRATFKIRVLKPDHKPGYMVKVGVNLEMRMPNDETKAEFVIWFDHDCKRVEKMRIILPHRRVGSCPNILSVGTCFRFRFRRRCKFADADPVTFSAKDAKPNEFFWAVRAARCLLYCRSSRATLCFVQ